MFDRFDHDELLAYIEGELEAADAARLEHELANSPRAAMQVERMRRDRELLRTQRDPNMPRSLLPRIESRLARPMLMETLREAQEAEDSGQIAAMAAAKPGAMRRQHRRAVFRQRLMKLSLAAVLMLTVGAGIWALIAAMNLSDHANEWITSWRSSATEPTRTGEDAAATVRGSDVKGEDVGDAFAWPPGAIVHHAPPGRLWADSDGVPLHGRDGIVGMHAVGDAPSIDLMLVIRADDTSAFESYLTELITALDAPAALVQNLSEAEAARLAEAWALAQGSQTDHSRQRQPSASGTNGATTRPGGDRVSRPADDALERLRRIREMRSNRAFDDVEQSRQLAGSPESAATFAQQLESSRRGATHTVTVTAGKLHDLLSALDSAADAEAMLIPLPDQEWSDDLDAPRTAGEAWLTHRWEMQRLLAQLERVSDDALIHLPLRVERASGR